MPSQRTSPAGYAQARRQRKHLTPAEVRLWMYLRNHQVRGAAFRKQHAIGRYVVDFCSPRQRLIVEVDGGGHIRQQDEDDRRSAFLRSAGYRVLRFSNDQVLQEIGAVITRIELMVENT